MKEHYERARLRAKEPEGGWPAAFGIITASNPQGRRISDAGNRKRTELLRGDLTRRGLLHFEITGYDPNSSHEEEGFGVFCEKQVAILLGKQWQQEAIFWVEAGWVSLVSCEHPGEEVALRPLEEMVA